MIRMYDKDQDVWAHFHVISVLKNERSGCMIRIRVHAQRSGCILSASEWSYIFEDQDVRANFLRDQRLQKMKIRMYPQDQDVSRGAHFRIRMSDIKAHATRITTEQIASCLRMNSLRPHSLRQACPPALTRSYTRWITTQHG